MSHHGKKRQRCGERSKEARDREVEKEAKKLEIERITAVVCIMEHVCVFTLW
jgi:hypothetical protein